MWFLKRLKEPSTWAGLSVIVGAFTVNPLVVPFIGKLGAAITAGLAIVLPENAVK